MTVHYNKREYTVNLGAQRSWLDFHVVRPWRRKKLKGFVWGRLSVLSAPLCPECLNDGVLSDGDRCMACCEPGEDR